MQETKCIGGLSEIMWGGQYHQQDRVYSMGECALALPAQIPGGSYNYMEVKKIGNVYGFDGGNYAGNVYDKENIAPCISTFGGGNQQPMVIEKQIVAQRGRAKGQILEPRYDGLSNSITTVQKDNMIVDIKQATNEGYIPCQVPGVANLSYPDSNTRRGRVVRGGQICPTLTTENIPNVLEEWTWEIDGEIYLIRIRKLTPKECWRLMGFSDENYQKAKRVNSNTQLYKQAGNSIVVPVLMALFSQLNIEGVPKWNDMTQEEREEWVNRCR